MKIVTPEIVAIYIVDILSLIILLSVLPFCIKVALKWDIKSTANEQYAMEKKTYLVATVVRIVLIFRVLLYALYIYSLDKLNIAVPGAMCATGVISSTVYGSWLMVLKTVNIFFFGLWAVLHGYDLKKPEAPYTKIKFAFYLPLFLLFLAEVVLVFMQFHSIDPMKVVSCCSTLFSCEGETLISELLSLEIAPLLTIFYGLYIILFLSYISGRPVMYSVFVAGFFFVALLALTSFFSTYVYELPTHKCPFCLLQKDYYYAGYLFYFLLFNGVFCGLSAGLFSRISKDGGQMWMRYSVISNGMFILAVSAYPVVYYIKNGVWL